MNILDKRCSTKEQIKGYAKRFGSLAAIIGVICFVIYGAVCAADSMKEQNRHAYESWTKINPQYSLTYDQRFTLYVKNLLPTQHNVITNNPSQPEKE